MLLQTLFVPGYYEVVLFHYSETLQPDNLIIVVVFSLAGMSR